MGNVWFAIHTCVLARWFVSATNATTVPTKEDAWYAEAQGSATLITAKNAQSARKTYVVSPVPNLLDHSQSITNATCCLIHSVMAALKLWIWEVLKLIYFMSGKNTVSKNDEKNVLPSHRVRTVIVLLVFNMYAICIEYTQYIHTHMWSCGLLFNLIFEHCEHYKLL